MTHKSFKDFLESCDRAAEETYWRGGELIPAGDMEQMIRCHVERKIDVRVVYRDGDTHALFTLLRPNGKPIYAHGG